VRERTRKIDSVPIGSASYGASQQDSLYSFKSGARNHLPANRSLGFCFEVTA